MSNPYKTEPLPGFLGHLDPDPDDLAENTGEPTAVDHNYIALVLQQCKQALEAADSGLRKNVPEKYRRLVPGANYLSEVAVIADRCRRHVLGEAVEDPARPVRASSPGEVYLAAPARDEWNNNG